MAKGTENVTAALAAMRDGTGTFDDVRAAVEEAEFSIRPPWTSTDSPEYVTVSGTFEDTVTPWLQRRVISRDQWRELRDIWKAKPMPEVSL